VEKRPSRRPKDGRTVMEKAQNRKKLTNLETLKGIFRPCNPVEALHSDEILNMPNVVDISLGRSDSEVLNSCVEVKDRDVSRSKEFKSQCASCQGEMNMEGSMENI
jgi:hypothetical protein